MNAMQRRKARPSDAGGRGGGGRRSPRRAARGLLLWALLFALGQGSAPAGEPDESGTACRIPAFFADDDAGLARAYDGVRRGLEEASLPRICRRKVEPDDAGGWEKAAKEVSAEAPAFLVAFGRKAAARVLAAPFRRGEGRIPAVYVDVAALVGDRAVPEALDPPAPCAVVRAEAAVEAWGRVVRELLPGRPQPGLRLPWTAESPEARSLRLLASAASGLDLRLARDGGGFDACFDWAPGVGETLEPFEATLAAARALRLPVLSADRARFGHGAAVVLVPDHALLGRVAAEAARRLADGEGADRPLRLVVRTTEVWVDLEAADEEGLKPPLAFLAAADRLRKAPAGAAPKEGGR